MGPLDWAVSLCCGEGGLVQRVRGAPVYEPARALPDDELGESDGDVSGGAAGSLGSPASGGSSLDGVELVSGNVAQQTRVLSAASLDAARMSPEVASLGQDAAYRDGSDSDDVSARGAVDV